MSRRARASFSAVLVVVLPALARADPPPPARCHGEDPAATAELAVPGEVVGLAAARRGPRLYVAARVLSVGRGRAGRTTIVAGALDADGHWDMSPRVVLTLRGRAAGPLEILATPAGFAVVASHERSAWVAQPGAVPAGDRSQELPAASRTIRAAPLLAPRADGTVALVWRLPGEVRVQPLTLALDASGAPRAATTPPPEPLALRATLDLPTPRAPVRVDAPARPAVGTTQTLHLPTHVMVVSAAEGPDGVLGLMARTAGSRHVVAVLDRAGALHWAGAGPVGCDGRYCPALEILAAPGGFVAAWRNRPTDDGLELTGARALDARGRARARPPEFIPMVHPQVVAGPQGQALALQLGRPIVLRGGARPVAVPSSAQPAGEYPTLARVWVNDALGPGLEVLSSTAAGTLRLGALRCEAPAER